ncbi:hypothetical protein LCI18_006273 [Fusarium solani-melongenae]|uniref:Uncharacterized protein n=1 Tax=Fusarium solani subsp. cucurbitae TaxID=2747967 RepID=A0ACD3Z2P4_FUSSC|nr:hypothetical protein LCI18_006273 [Fusarium solani-melongenae]
MPPRSQPRAMTFTGCWTCKRRKVRCDLRPTACKNCEKRGIVCEGYGIRLQWVSDSLGQAESGTGLQGRRSLRLDQTCNLYESATIDNFLSAIDHATESGLSSQQGPFSTFPAKPTATSGMDASTTQPETFPTSIVPMESDFQDEVQGQQWIAQRVSSLELQFPGTESTPDPTQWWPFDSDLTSSSSGLELDNSPSDISPLGCFPPVQESSDQQASFDTDHVERNHQLTPTSGAVLNLTKVDTHLPKHISITLFGNAEVDSLMNHYNLHVADLLQPIDHSGNPFRTLYLSTALEGVSYRAWDTETPTAKVYSALSHSLVAASAFHRWNCGQLQPNYRDMGVKHRYYAIQALQGAIQQAAPAANYKILMVAVLSLITVGVLSGEGDDFRFHLNAAAQLRSLRSRWKIMSRQSRRLNEIGAFLALLARTLIFQTSTSPWPSCDAQSTAEDSTIIERSGSYEYLYGVTPDIAMLIYQTCQLAEHLARFHEKGEFMPDDFLEKCEQVGNRLQAWRFNSEKISSIPRGDELRFTILTHQAKAWHSAALIYYYTRIQDCSPQDLVQEVECVAEHMQTTEDVKLAFDTAYKEPTMAPLTWPALIASCNAMRSRREVWRRWWARMQLYRIANIDKQWSIVQQIWEIVDGREEKGEGPVTWTQAFDSIGIHVLPT